MFHDPKEEITPVTSMDEEVTDLFQYEALIEQLRFEKQEYANKCAQYQRMLHRLYETYRDQLGLSADKAVDKMNTNELYLTFKLKQPE